MQDGSEAVWQQLPDHTGVKLLCKIFRLNGSWKDVLIEVKCFALISMFSDDGRKLPKCIGTCCIYVRSIVGSNSIFGSRKPGSTAVGIRCADHATPSIRQVGTNLADKRRSLGRCS
jgi:hypothetical protein